MEWIDAAVARHWHSKLVSVATDTDSTIGDMVFSMQSVPKFYNEDQLDMQVSQQSLVRGRSRQLAVLSCID
jgi:hypothetical protein